MKNSVEECKAGLSEISTETLGPFNLGGIIGHDLVYLLHKPRIPTMNEHYLIYLVI